jgi:hypothetical protein
MKLDNSCATSPELSCLTNRKNPIIFNLFLRHPPHSPPRPAGPQPTLRPTMARYSTRPSPCATAPTACLVRMRPHFAAPCGPLVRSRRKSMFRGANSVIGRENYPVRLARELGRKWLHLKGRSAAPEGPSGRIFESYPVIYPVRREIEPGPSQRSTRGPFWHFWQNETPQKRQPNQCAAGVLRAWSIPTVKSAPCRRT